MTQNKKIGLFCTPSSSIFFPPRSHDIYDLLIHDSSILFVTLPRVSSGLGHLFVGLLAGR